VAAERVEAMATEAAVPAATAGKPEPVAAAEKLVSETAPGAKVLAVEGNPAPR
jgi:hypothetical protein